MGEKTGGKGREWDGKGGGRREDDRPQP